jgi:hypothetical protein
MADYRNPSAISALPAHMHGAMLRWIEHGIYPGGFLTAVLENDLRAAVARADMVNATRLPDYVRYLYNDAPSGCWGSPAKVRAWHEQGGLKRGLVRVETETDNHTKE